ncbi:MAG TPA: hypothetical protein VGY55_06270 [Pirellulales bacterium]|nr:hypothetical protein [Pirellulales bacterium]
MESSVGLVFRALVMLACLAVVPLVAMYGKYVPDFAQAVMEAYKSRTQAKAVANPQAAADDAPPFAGAPIRANNSPTPPLSGRGPSAAAPAPWTDSGQAARPLSEFRQPGAPDQSAGFKQASFDAPLTGHPGEAAGDIARRNEAPPAVPGNLQTAGAPGENQSDCTTQFRRMEQRLRELGATYYLLETWGSSGDRYRFFCKMALAGNADNNRNRIFQATAADPLRAMRDVLDQVEEWHSGRQP